MGSSLINSQSPVINGTLNPVQQPSTWGRGDTGNYEIYKYRGAKAGVVALAQYIASIPSLVYEVQDLFGGLSEITIHWPWNADGLVNPNTDIITRWEMFPLEAEKDLLDVQDAGGIVPGLSTGPGGSATGQNIKSFIRANLQNPPDGISRPFLEVTDFASSSAGGSGKIKDPNVTTDQASDAYMLYTLMTRGQTSYPMDTPVLRRTVTTSEQYLGFSLSNVRKIMTTSYLINFDGPVTSAGFAATVVSYINQFTLTDPLLIYGWYKKFPTVQQIALQKWQIVQEWVFGWYPWPVYVGFVNAPLGWTAAWPPFTP